MKSWPIAYADAWGRRGERLLPGPAGRARAAQALTRLLAHTSIPPSHQEMRGHIEHLRERLSHRAVYDQIRWLRDAFAVVDPGEYDELLAQEFAAQSALVHGSKEPKRLRRYIHTKGLPIVAWPVDAASLWRRAIDGPLADLAPRYRRSLATAYARWLR